MSEAKHTPGPWRVVDIPFNDKRNYREGYGIAIEADDSCVALIDSPDATQRGNAHLIAAAPALLAALERVMATMPCDHDATYEFYEATKDACAAIAEAKGGRP